MGGLLKKSAVFVVLVAWVLTMVNSSSGISQFASSRETKMKVVNSEDAFISLPEIIEIDVKLLKKTMNYYKFITIEPKDKNESQTDTVTPLEPVKIAEPKETIEVTEIIKVVEKNNPITIKEFLRSEETIEITGVKSNLVIGNNMRDQIELVDIVFDNPKLKINYSTYLLEMGEQINIPVIYEGADILEVNDENHISKAILSFQWNSGKSTIYKDVIVNFKVSEEIIEIIEE